MLKGVYGERVNSNYIYSNHGGSIVLLADCKIKGRVSKIEDSALKNIIIAWVVIV